MKSLLFKPAKLAAIASSLCATLLVAACGSDSQPTQLGGGNGTPTSPAETNLCNEQSWFAGVLEVCNGKLVYRDYVFDDYGADAGLISPAPALLNLAGRAGKSGNPFANTPGLLSPTAGDARYPAGAESTADLVKLTLERTGNSIAATFEMNALYTGNQTIAAIAVDTDNNPATGNVQLLGLAVKGADAVYEFNTGNAETNLIKGTFPLPAASEWKVWAATAQSNRQVMNVAFRGVDEQADATGGIPNQALPGKGNWWEDKQAAALAAGDISGFFAAVKTSELSTGFTRKAEVAPGFRQRVYTSKYTAPNSTGEGMILAGVTGRENLESEFCGQYFNFVGKYQPYGVYIPESGIEEDKLSLQVIMHGCEANHASQINQPNMQKQFGEDLKRILVAPLGRGPYGFYSDLSERDVLDVLDDALATFPIDEDRVFLGGYSMGGYGTARLAALYPDRFAGISNWVGFTGSILNTPLPGNPLLALEDMTGGALPLSSRIGGFGNIIDYLGNLRHVPGTHSYAALDELVQVNTGLAWAAKLGQSEGVQYEFFMHIPAEHLTLIALDEWTKEAQYTKNLKRVKNPSRITFKTNEAFAFPEYNIKHDKAYWLSSIKGRVAGDISLDAQSFGCSNPQNNFEDGQTAGSVPVPFVQTFRRAIGMPTEGALQNKLVATFTNLAAVNIDLTGSCLKPGAAYEVNSDGPVILNFSNGKTLTLPAGRSTGNI